MRFLIIGQGNIGQAVAIQLARAGHDITAVARSAKCYPDDVAVTFWQKNALDLTKNELDDFDGVAIIITPDKNSDRVQAYKDSYLAVCQHMADLKVDCQKVLFVSSTSVYGENDGQLIDENTPARPNNPTALVLLNAENLISTTYGRRAIIVRPSGIYGGSNRMIELAKKAHQDGVPSHHHTNRIHQTDLVAIIAKILVMATPKPLYLVSDFDGATLAQVLGFICQVRGYPMPALMPSAPTGKRIMPNIDKSWLTFENYRSGYAV